MTGRDSGKAKTTRREGNLYDAVAGRLTSEGFYRPGAPASTRDTSSTKQTIISPDDALYRRKDAPLRNQYDDEYAQHRFLTPEQKLPDSDLLKTVHAYAADFYAKNTNDKGKTDEHSLDETALLAMGILLEEAAAQCLGQTGALALAEPE